MLPLYLNPSSSIPDSSSDSFSLSNWINFQLFHARWNSTRIRNELALAWSLVCDNLDEMCLSFKHRRTLAQGWSVFMRTLQYWLRRCAKEVEIPSVSPVGGPITWKRQVHIPFGRIKIWSRISQFSGTEMTPHLRWVGTHSRLVIEM